MEDHLEKLLETAGTHRWHVPGCPVDCGVTTSCRVFDRSPDDSLDRFVISWILTGRGLLSEGGHDYKIEDMCVCIRRPDRYWHMTLDDAPSVRLYFDLQSGLYPALCLMIPEFDRLPPVLKTEYRQELADEFFAVIRSIRAAPADSFYTVLPRLIRFLLELTGIRAARETSPLTRARSLLKDPSCRLSLAQIAETCDINYNTFRKQFEVTFGISPGQYRMQCRMDAAREALASGASVADIAEELGFSDVYSFTHRFSAVVGVSPAKYRNEMMG